MSRKFTIKKVALNLNKMNAIKVIMKNYPQHPLSVDYDEE
jgi:hypothetical protein